MAESFKRYRFSVPNADESVNAWIAAQSNLSYSIRELIKTAIRCNGYADVSCYPVRQILAPGQAASIPLEFLMLSQGQGLQQASGAAAAPGYPQSAYPNPAPNPVVSGYPAGGFPQSAPQAAGMPAAPVAPAPAAVPTPAPAPPPSQTFISPEELLDM